MKMKIGDQSIDLRPFIWATFGWALISIAGITVLVSEPGIALKSLALYFTLAVTDLFFLVKTVAAVLLLMSDRGAKNRSAYAIQAVTFGSLKFAFLGMIALCLWKVPTTTSGGVLFGLSTLVFVPLAGGMLWSQLQLKQESAEEGLSSRSASAE